MLMTHSEELEHQERGRSFTTIKLFSPGTTASKHMQLNWGL